MSGDTPKHTKFLRARFAKELEGLESASRILRAGSKDVQADVLELMLNVCHNCLQRAVALHARIEKAES